LQPSHREICDAFGYVPDPARPGWLVRPQSSDNRFLDVYGRMEARVDGDGRARISLMLGDIHRNVMGTTHGGFLLALVDHALFMGPGLLGIERAVGGVTIDVSSQFLAPATVNQPLDAVVEVLRDTYKMVFLRGTLEQDGNAVLAFSGLIKKASAKS
jgi:acyl-coenzyme A thioesterase PaaI-like protein